MATPSELSLEEIRKYLLDNGGSARNHDLVKYFKKFLTDPETRVEARNEFKDYVNTLATIKNDEGEKYLVLKKKYRNEPLSLATSLSSSSLQFESSNTPMVLSDLATPVSPLREPPPYRSPPLASAPSPSSPGFKKPQSLTSGTDLDREGEYGSSKIEEDSNAATEDDRSDVSSPPVPPRRKSQDKLRVENNNKENIVPVPSEKKNIEAGEASVREDDGPASATTSSAEQLSVRERMQRFNKMASETDLQGRGINGSTTPTKKRSDKGADEDDRASVASQLDGKSREWLVRAAQGDYQALAKLAAEEPRLARLRTALHWGAKHGNEDIVKLIAGTYKDYIKGVNEPTGYTPLHIAMQFRHENIFNLLVQVYGANQELRDYSGKKARQYSESQKAAVSEDTFLKIKARKKHAEKDLGFLRIGSLNVRVKRTTEAFSQFLGVASSNAVAATNEKIHKSWGSADNIQTDHKVMPPPKYAPIKKRRSRRAQDFISPRDEPGKNHVNNNPQSRGNGHNTCPPRRGSQQQRSSTTNLAATGTSHPQNDSDSDNACGFDSAWRGSAIM